MKNFFRFLSLSFVMTLVFCFTNTQNASAQQGKTKWTYVMKQNNVTYKVHFQQERGTVTVQMYASSSNKWNFGTILSTNQDNNKLTYYKVKDTVNNNIYEMWSSADGSLKVTSGSSKWMYYLEK